MKYFFLLAVLLSTLFASAQVAGQVLRPSEVPDESVLPQWSAKMTNLLKERESYFIHYRTTNQPSGPLSDADLINGKSSQPTDVPKLDGAEDCLIEQNSHDGAMYYTCYFLPRGATAEAMQNDFVRLVRLVEKATGGSARLTNPPFVQPQMEVRHIMVDKIPGWTSFIELEAQWFGKSTEARLERSHMPLMSLSRLSVTIASDAPRDFKPLSASVSGSDEIDEIIKSGRYTQMPTAHRVGSSGSGLASIKITNDTGYALSLVYEGSTSQTIIIPAGSAATIQLPAGFFRVLGRVSATGVLPFVGSETVGAGDNFVTSFFIK